MIYQYVPILLRGDAVGNEVTAISDHLTNSGVENMIVTDQITKGKNNSITYEAFTKKATKKDVLFFHMASSCAVWKSLRDLPCKKIMIYHNITPAEFFLPYAKDAVKTSKQARAQLAEGAVIRLNLPGKRLIGAVHHILNPVSADEGAVFLPQAEAGRHGGRFDIKTILQAAGLHHIFQHERSHRTATDVSMT